MKKPSKYGVYPEEKIREFYGCGKSFTLQQFSVELPKVFPRILCEAKFTRRPINEHAYKAFSKEHANIRDDVMTMTVNNLVQCSLISDSSRVFNLALKGAALLHNADVEKEKVRSLLNCITGVNTLSIQSAVHLAQYELILRHGPNRVDPRAVTLPDTRTSELICQLTEVTIDFLQRHGPFRTRITLDGAYDGLVRSGTIDYMSEDMLYNLKVSVNHATAGERLQLMAAYMMLDRTIEHRYRTVKTIGVVNPVSGYHYTIDMSSVDTQALNIIYDSLYGVNSSIDEEHKTVYRHASVAMTDATTPEEKRRNILTWAVTCFPQSPHIEGIKYLFGRFFDKYSNHVHVYTICCQVCDYLVGRLHGHTVLTEILSKGTKQSVACDGIFVSESMAGDILALLNVLEAKCQLSSPILRLVN